MPLASAARRAPETDAVDFTVSSSLPPMVAGAVAGEMELSVPCLYPKPGVLCSTRYLRDRQSQPMFAVRMKWWGDGGPGTVLKPTLLNGRDDDGEMARLVRSSRATCALFPIRCGVDGLVAYLKDMGSITLEVLVHEGGPKGARHVGRCVIPVGKWGGNVDKHPGSGDSVVVAEGYFPVLTLDGNRYAGNLRVCLRACLGPRSKLRSLVALGKIVADKATMGGETQGALEALYHGGGMATSTGVGQNAGVQAGIGLQEERSKAWRSEPGFRRASEGGRLPARASFDSDDLSSGSSEGSLVSNTRHPRESAQLSSFQLNEALANFDASDTLPIWPAPNGSLYHPPETHGDAPPTPRGGQTSRGRLADTVSASVSAGAASNFYPAASITKERIAKGRVEIIPPTRVGMAISETTRIPANAAGAPSSKQKIEQEGKGHFATSVSPERQAPDPNPSRTGKQPGARDVGHDKTSAESMASPPGRPRSPRPHALSISTSRPSTDNDGIFLTEILNRGKDLREKMASASGSDEVQPALETPAVPLSPALETPAAPLSQAKPFLPVGTDRFAGITAQPGLVSGALLGSSLRDDIEGIFDTLSDDGPAAADEAGVLVRDPVTRGHEDRMVNLLLEAAGPPPSSLAFPALAAVENRRADSLARVRFLRIRLSRLVMFGSMASSAEGHGWQLRFRLPAFATPPGQGSAGGRKTGGRAGGGEGGSKSRDSRVVSLPVPPRVPRVSISSRGRAKAAVDGKNRSASRAVGIASSVLRVRRGFGASDLVMGETSLLEEMVCAVDVDDTCVRRWMDTTVEFLLIDGKSDGASRARPGQPKTDPRPGKPQQRTESLTVGPGDRVAAVATLPLRDLLLSAELGVAATLDLVEVSDFWAAEDARAAAAGNRGRKGRPLRNPYREDAPTAARPLVLGDRAVGALAVALELVPGEKDVSPEHSRPAVENWLKSRWYEGVEKTDTRGEVTDKVGEASGVGGVGFAQGNDDKLRWGAGLERPLVGAAEEQGASAPLHANKHVETVGVDLREVTPLESSVGEKDKMGGPCGRGGSPSAPPAARPPELNGDRKEEHQGLAVGPATVDCSVVLRIEDLTLSLDVGPGVERVRVAYSFTQVEGCTPTLTHRSVCGFRGQTAGPNGEQPVASFAFNHQETFPAPADSSTWRRGQSTSRVFEVWGRCAEDHGGSDGGGAGLGGVLIGLAKISLRAFAAFVPAGVADFSQAVAADGPVAVVDPFSGRSVGELRVFLALGASAAIDALSSRGKGVGTLERPLNASQTAADGGGCEEDEEKEERREEQEKPKMEGNGEGGGGFEGEGEGAYGEGGVLGDLSVNLEPPALGDSVEELSILLNPGRVRRAEMNTARCSGGFSGLVRHVVELSAVGELPVALGDGSSGQEAADEPVGCMIEYSLPTGQPLQASLDVKGGGDSDSAVAISQTHDLWWDGDSGILNSRARHTIKVHGNAVGKLPDGPTNDSRDAGGGGGSGGGGESGTPEDRLLHGLLDCVFGPGDVGLNLFWSSGEVGAGQREPQPRHHGHGEARTGGDRAHRPLGKALLRREDLLPLVRRTSASVVLRLPIEPSSAEGGDGELRPPETLPLSVSYRREPSAVARRKSHASSARRAAKERDGKDDDGSLQEVGVKLMRDGGQARGGGHLTGDYAFDGSFGANPSEGNEESVGGEARGERRQSGESCKSLPSHPRGAGSPEGSVDGGTSVGNDSHGSRESGRKMLGIRSPRTDHLLPARTTLCVRVTSISWMTSSTLVTKGGGFIWASFDFPGPGGYGVEEMKRGGVFVWQPEAGGGETKRENEHWSPPVAANEEGSCDRVPLDWRVELPIAIDAEFVEFMHTRSLQLSVWRGARDDWPRAGTACGTAKVALRPLLTTLDGVDGDVSVVPEGGRGSGNVAFHLFFKHRGVGSTDADLEQGAGQARGSEERRVERREPELVQEETEALVAREGSRDADDSDALRGAGAVAASGRFLGLFVSQSRNQELKAQPSEPEPSGGKLNVCIERAMRLLSAPGESTEPGASLDVLPSTYVTFRWEEGGKPPLRSPLVLAPAAAGGADVGNPEAWQGTTPGDWEAITPLVANTSSPVFDHAAQLHLTSPEAWGRVCGPSAALVFRVWRRARYSWWDDPQTLAASDQPCDATSGGDKVAGVAAAAAAAGSRLGDKLIGSAMVGLEVLLGSFGSGEGPGLREIDGWYHVLDDLRRPQGQIKVKVCPQPPAAASDQEPQALGHASTPGAQQREANTGFEQLFFPANLAPSPGSGVTDSGDQNVSGDYCAWTSGSGASPPLDDTQTHLRAVHALLDSLPAEFRSAHQPPPPPPPAPPSSPPTPRTPPPPLSALSSPLVREESSLKLPSLCEEPDGAARSHGAARLSGGTVSAPGSATEERCGDCEPSSLPELRRMLLSLDRVDRRLFALGSSASGAVDANAEGVGADEDREGDGDGGPERQEMDDSQVAGLAAGTTAESMETTTAERTQVMELDSDNVNLAASGLQRLWRIWSKKRREEAVVKAERASCALRERFRDEAAAKIQTAHRRTQARHRMRATADERRRREDRQRCRADACATLERAWKAFEVRRRASRELIEARVRVAAAARRAEVTARSATVIQAVWRGALDRAAVCRLSASQAKLPAKSKLSRGGAHGAVASATMPVYRNLLRPAPLCGERLAGAATTPRPLPFVMPSTFYNQLSQDPRRRHRLPDAHLAATETLPSAALPPALAVSAAHAVDGGMVDTKEERAVLPSGRFGPRPLAQSAGAAVRPPRFADLETARIARIMNGNLQHWAGVRSGGGAGGSSSSDDFDL